MNKVLLIGAGAREHAIAIALKSAGAEIYAVMKHRNPGIARIAKNYVIGDHDSPEFVTGIDWVKKGTVDFAFIGPEVPLIRGMVDSLSEKGIPVVGPKKNAAIIEGSKEFMRELMRRYDIPGGVEYRVFDSPDALEEYLNSYEKEFVVKPIGVTGGKGVCVMGDHFSTKKEGMEYAKRILKEKIGGESKVLIEEKLVGEEFTLQVFTDGKNLAPMPLVQDFKRAYEGDRGPNTGGMGSYSMPDHRLPFVPEVDVEKAKDILSRIISAMRAEGREYRGVLYGQFMETADGPKIIELNCRFGDPEAMNVLSVLSSNMVEISWGIIEGHIPDVSYEKKAAVVKYIVPDGYGTANVAKNVEIEIDEKGINDSGAHLYYASVDERDGKIYTTGSRSLAVVGVANSIVMAEKIAENSLEYIHGRVFSRHDIATQEVILAKIERMKMLRAH